MRNMNTYIGIDLGTSGTKFLRVAAGESIAAGERRAKRHPHPAAHPRERRAARGTKAAKTCRLAMPRGAPFSGRRRRIGQKGGAIKPKNSTEIARVSPLRSLFFAKKNKKSEINIYRRKFLL